MRRREFITLLGGVAQGKAGMSAQKLEQSFKTKKHKLHARIWEEICAKEIFLGFSRVWRWSRFPR
jgi:hypothetical protein